MARRKRENVETTINAGYSPEAAQPEPAAPAASIIVEDEAMPDTPTVGQQFFLNVEADANVKPSGAAESRRVCYGSCPEFLHAGRLAVIGDFQVGDKLVVTVEKA